MTLNLFTMFDAAFFLNFGIDISWDVDPRVTVYNIRPLQVHH